jgi:hypothetical protein
MKTTTLVRLFLSVVLLSAAGCSTLNDARQAKGTGKSHLYNASFDIVWDAATQAVTDMGLQVASKSKEEGYILAQKGMSAFSYGENVAVFVEKADDQQTKVEVVSKKAMATNVFAWNWEKPILDRISEIIEKK